MFNSPHRRDFPRRVLDATTSFFHRAAHSQSQRSTRGTLAHLQLLLLSMLRSALNSARRAFPVLARPQHVLRSQGRAPPRASPLPLVRAEPSNALVARSLFHSARPARAVVHDGMDRYPSLTSAKGWLRGLDYFGTLVFAVSGTVTAGAVGMDVLG